MTLCADSETDLLTGKRYASVVMMVVVVEMYHLYLATLLLSEVMFSSN